MLSQSLRSAKVTLHAKNNDWDSVGGKKKEEPGRDRGHNGGTAHNTRDTRRPTKAKEREGEGGGKNAKFGYLGPKLIDPET